MFEEAGFTVSSSEYILRETVNKKEDLSVPRVFVQGKFVAKELVSPECNNLNDNTVETKTVKEDKVRKDHTSENCDHKTSDTNNVAYKSEVLKDDKILVEDLKKQTLYDDS